MKNTTIPKLLSLIIFLSFSLVAQAQIVQGSFRLGPDISFSSTKTEIDGSDLEVREVDLILEASAGYYVIDILEVGVGFSYISQTNEVNNFETNSSGLAFGPHIEYNVGLSSQFYLPLGAGLQYTTLSLEDDSNDEISYSGVSYGLYTGIEFISNNKLGAALL